MLGYIYFWKKFCFFFYSYKGIKTILELPFQSKEENLFKQLLKSSHLSMNICAFLREHLLKQRRRGNRSQRRGDVEFKTAEQAINKPFNKSTSANESDRKSERPRDGESFSGPAAGKKENLIIFSLLCFLRLLGRFEENRLCCFDRSRRVLVESDRRKLHQVEWVRLTSVRPATCEYRGCNE